MRFLYSKISVKHRAVILKMWSCLLLMERKESRYWPTLNKTLTTNGRELTNALERQITLAIIDDAWKEHLRAMDDLKQSVQTAYLEQKDPLVIYKIEAFDLFKRMDSEVNRDIVSFLCHAGIPMEQANASRSREGQRAENRYEPDAGQ